MAQRTSTAYNRRLLERFRAATLILLVLLFVVEEAAAQLSAGNSCQDNNECSSNLCLCSSAFGSPCGTTEQVCCATKLMNCLECNPTTGACDTCDDGYDIHPPSGSCRLMNGLPCNADNECVSNNCGAENVCTLAVFGVPPPPAGADGTPCGNNDATCDSGLCRGKCCNDNVPVQCVQCSPGTGDCALMGVGGPCQNGGDCKHPGGGPPGDPSGYCRGGVCCATSVTASNCEQCSNPDGGCISCAPGYHLDDGGLFSAPTCQELKSAGDNCEDSNECLSGNCLGISTQKKCCHSSVSSDAHCTGCGSSPGFCLSCSPTHYLDTDGFPQCLPKEGAGDGCLQNDECPNSACKNGICCDSIASYDSECDSCSSSAGGCDRCVQGYHLPTGGSTCVEQEDPGEGCSEDGGCKDEICRVGVCCVAGTQDIAICLDCSGSGDGQCNQCHGDYWLDTGVYPAQCIAKGNPGDACTSNQQCLSDKCRNFACCRSDVQSASICTSCRAGASKGDCDECEPSTHYLRVTPLPQRCMNKVIAGHECGDDTHCLSGACKGSKCCDGATSAVDANCNSCAPSDGYCVNCDAGYFKDGTPPQCYPEKSDGDSCAGHLQCISGECKGGRCCNDGVDGTCTACDVAGNCDDCINAVDCNNAGGIVTGTRTGGCNCDCRPSNIGAACEGCATKYENPPTCSPVACTTANSCNGRASSVSGDLVVGCTCLSCNPGYDGVECQECAPGYSGHPSCVPDGCSNVVNCNGRASGVSGDVINGCTCICDTGYDGSTCQVCATNYHNARATGCEPIPCTTANSCNGRASSVSGDLVVGCTCLSCNIGYSGSDCHECASGYAGYPTCVPENGLPSTISRSTDIPGGLGATILVGSTPAVDHAFVQGRGVKIIVDEQGGAIGIPSITVQPWPLDGTGDMETLRGTISATLSIPSLGVTEVNNCDNAEVTCDFPARSISGIPNTYTGNVFVTRDGSLIITRVVVVEVCYGPVTQVQMFVPHTRGISGSLLSPAGFDTAPLTARARNVAGRVVPRSGVAVVRCNSACESLSGDRADIVDGIARFPELVVNALGGSGTAGLRVRMNFDDGTFLVSDQSLVELSACHGSATSSAKLAVNTPAMHVGRSSPLVILGGPFVCNAQGPCSQYVCKYTDDNNNVISRPAVLLSSCTLRCVFGSGVFSRPLSARTLEIRRNGDPFLTVPSVAVFGAPASMELVPSRSEVSVTTPGIAQLPDMTFVVRDEAENDLPEVDVTFTVDGSPVAAAQTARNGSGIVHGVSWTSVGPNAVTLMIAAEVLSNATVTATVIVDVMHTSCSATTAVQAIVGCTASARIAGAYHSCSDSGFDLALTGLQSSVQPAVAFLGSSQCAGPLVFTPGAPGAGVVSVRGCDFAGRTADFGAGETTGLVLGFSDGTAAKMFTATTDVVRPRVDSVSGCGTDAHPSTGECVFQDAAQRLTIRGARFDTATAVLLVDPAAAPTAPRTAECASFTVSADGATIECTSVSGYGRGLAVVVELASGARNAVSAQASRALVTFRPVLAHLCAVDVHGAVCGGHGRCDPPSGECVCDATAVLGHWAGVACERCAAGYFGAGSCTGVCATASGSSEACSGNGACDAVSGVCVCAPGARGTVCQLECPGGVHSPCNGHGTCDASAVCVCSGNYGGAACGECAAGFGGADCGVACPTTVGGGVCDGHGACRQDTGTCLCAAGRCGPACESTSCASERCPAGMYGAACASVCPATVSGGVCGGHGACDGGVSGSGACVCAAGFGGAACNFACPAPDVGGVATICSGHGVCDGEVGACECAATYGSLDCSRRCPGTSSTGGVGGSVCSGHGVCLDGAGRAVPVCSCADGWTGADCALECPTNAGGAACSGHGTCGGVGSGCLCDRSAATGHYGGYRCESCAAGYSGPGCNTTCAVGADGAVCSGHGSCEGSTLTCECEAPFTGPACGECASGFFGPTCALQCPGGWCAPCGGRGVCFDGVAGNGTCACERSDAEGHWAGFECTECAAGYYGSRCRRACPADRATGAVCGGHGSCSDGLVGTGECACEARFRLSNKGLCTRCVAGAFGAACAECPGGVGAAACSGHGTCDDGVGGSGACVCAFPYEGADCSVACPVSSGDGQKCGGHGVCTANATCECDAGWTSAGDASGACTRCEAGRYGPACASVCPGYDAASVSDPTATVCGGSNGVCADGTTGAGTCSCAAGWWGAGCTKQCALGANGAPCSGHGACEQATGQCVCFASASAGYFEGATCERCVKEYLSADCKQACPVGADGSVCNLRGTCWDGQCLDCAPQVALGDTASVVCGVACTLFGETLCPSGCPAGYWGAACDQVCAGGDASAGGAGYCSGHGACRRSTGGCLCAPGYSGQTCGVACPVFANAVCGGHGYCDSTSGCVCDAGYGGAACSVACPAGLVSASNGTCSGRGYCSARDGTCACASGFAGSACELECAGGAGNACSGHGACQAEDGSCVCAGRHVGVACERCLEGYAGAACDLKCSAYGRVSADSSRCECSPGYAGPTCEVACPGVEEADVCSGHGVCSDGSAGDGTCSCAAGYFTANCSVHCTVEQCRASEGLENPQCNAQNGTCECARSPTEGYFAGERCDRCETFYWGARCASVCTCNGNGGCERNTGTCECFGDAERGHWGGAACLSCARGFVGMDCRSVDIQLSTNPWRSLKAAVRTRLDLPVVSAVDAELGVAFTGNAPLLVVNISVAPPEVVQESVPGIAVGETVLAVRVQRTAYMVVARSDDGLTRTVYWYPRAVPLTAPTRQLQLVSPPSSASSSRRQMVELGGNTTTTNATTNSSGPTLVTTLTDDAHGAVLEVYADGSLRSLRTDGAALVELTGTVASSFATVHSATVAFGGTRLVVVGGGRGDGSTTAQWLVGVTALPYDPATSSWTYHTQATTPIADCDGAQVRRTSVSGNVCDAALRCIGDDSAEVSGGVRTLYCLVRQQTGPVAAAIRLAVDATGSGGDGPHASVAATSSQLATFGALVEWNATAMAVDARAKLVLAAYNTAGLPTTILKLAAASMRVTGTYQLAITGLENEIVSSMAVKGAERELLAVIRQTREVRVTSFNLYGIARITPDVIDSAGGTRITVVGEGFAAFDTPVCRFTAVANTTATLVDDATLVCDAPVADESLGDCAELMFNVAFGNRSTDVTNVPMWRPLAPELIRASATPLGLDRGSMRRASVVAVHGYGFAPNAHHAECYLVEEATGREIFRTNATQVRFANSTMVECVQPAGAAPSRPPARLYYSQDGQRAAPSSVPYAVAGAAHTLRVGFPSAAAPAAGSAASSTDVSTGFAAVATPSYTLASDAVVRVPRVDVHVADTLGNSLLGLDELEPLYVPRRVTAFFVESGLGMLTTLRNATEAEAVSSAGVARFDGLELVAPRVGTVPLFFTARIGSQTGLAVLELRIVTGVGVRLALEEVNATKAWVVGTEVESSIPPPRIVVADGAGNAVRDASLVPPTAVATWEVVVWSAARSAWVHEARNASAPANLAAVYEFPYLAMRGLYGRRYRIKFALPVVEEEAAATPNSIPSTSGNSNNAKVLEAYYTPELRLARCLSTQYGRIGTPHCLACPRNGICDGSTVVDVEDGHWRGAGDARVIYPCPAGTDGCGTGFCQDGYSGPMCSVCEPGYGKTGARCVKCEARRTNLVAIALISVVVILGVLALVLSSLKEVGPMKADATTIVPILLKMLANHLQVSGRAGATVRPPALLQSLFETQTTASSVGSPNISFVSCEARANLFEQFLAVLMLPVALIVITFVLLAVRAVVRWSSRRHRQELEDELEAPKPRSQQFKTFEEDHAEELRLEAQGAYDQHEDFDLRAEFAKTAVDAKNNGKRGDAMDDPFSNLPKPTAAEEPLDHQDDNRSVTSSGSGSSSAGRVAKKVRAVEEETRHYTLYQVTAVAVVVILFLVYPTILEIASDLLRCEELDYGDLQPARSVVIADKTIDCETSEYAWYRNIAITVFLAVGLGVPAFCVMLVRVTAAASMGGDMFATRYLFFFTTGGFEADRWYWESIIMIRKASVLAATVLVANATLRSYVCMWLILLWLCVGAALQPFEDKRLSMLETCGLLTVTATLNLGQLFPIFEEQGNESAVVGLTWAVFLLNFIVLLVFVYFVLSAVSDSLREQYLQRPDKLWLLTCCYGSSLMRVEEEAREKEREIRALRKEVLRWQAIARSDGGRLQAMLEFTSILMQEFEEEASARAAVQSYLCAQTLVDHKIAEDVLVDEDLSALFQQERAVIDTLLQLEVIREARRRRRDELAAAEEDAAQERLRAIAKLRERSAVQERYQKAFSHLEVPSAQMMRERSLGAHHQSSSGAPALPPLPKKVTLRDIKRKVRAASISGSPDGTMAQESTQHVGVDAQESNSTMVSPLSAAGSSAYASPKALPRKRSGVRFSVATEGEHSVDAQGVSRSTSGVASPDMMSPLSIRRGSSMLGQGNGTGQPNEESDMWGDLEGSSTGTDDDGQANVAAFWGHSSRM